MSEFGMNGIRNSEFGIRNRRRFCALHSALRIPHSAFPSFRTPHSGVTLVELLITITIIALLGTAILGVASVATNSAREARSRDKIARIHSLLMEHYDSYKIRRVKLRQPVQTAINNISNPRQRGEALAQARLYALRELMLMEMPDRWSDVVLDQVGNNPRPLPLYYAERTGLSALYARSYNRMRMATNSLTGQTNTQAEILQNQSAECLYMIVMYACGDGESRALFSENDIGDTDGDGAPEFIDGWGNPISFLRWAPGFESDAQLNIPKISSLATKELREQAIAADHDPYDMFRREANAYRLVPLIYSIGSDEESGVLGAEDSSVPWYQGQAIDFPNLRPVLSPYPWPDDSYHYYDYPNLDAAPGQVVDRDAATDNIHNHLIGTR